MLSYFGLKRAQVTLVATVRPTRDVQLLVSNTDRGPERLR